MVGSNFPLEKIERTYVRCHETNKTMFGWKFALKVPMGETQN